MEMFKIALVIAASVVVSIIIAHFVPALGVIVSLLALIALVVVTAIIVVIGFTVSGVINPKFKWLDLRNVEVLAILWPFVGGFIAHIAVIILILR